MYSHYRGRGEQKVCENLFELTMTLLIGTGILATILLSLVQKPFLEILGAAGSVQTEAIKYTAIIIAGSILQVAGTESCLFEKYESVAGSNAQHGGRICSQYSGELLSDVPIEYGNQGSRI